MARPREFDRDAALEKALRVFWAKGFAATSTDDLRVAMGIGRQSLYGAFGDKRTLYLEALDTYQQRTNTGHVMRLSGPTSPIKASKTCFPVLCRKTIASGRWDAWGWISWRVWRDRPGP